MLNTISNIMCCLLFCFWTHISAYLSFVVIVTEAVLVGARRRMTIALIVVGNNRTWRSRLLCEYHLWLICMTYMLLSSNFNQFYIEHCNTLPVTFKSAFYLLCSRNQFTCGFNLILHSVRFQSWGQSAWTPVDCHLTLSYLHTGPCFYRYNREWQLPPQALTSLKVKAREEKANVSV